MEEEDLIRKLKAADRSAFNELVQMYGKKVLNTCYRFLLSREDAEDVSQDVFVTVYQSMPSFRSDSKLSTWIYRIAVTKSLDAIKRQRRKKRLITVGKMLHLEEVAQWLVGGNNANTHVENQETLQEVMRALDTLPDSQRVAFTLSKIDGYSNSEIAEIMKTTVLAVEALVHRAKKKMGEELKRILQE